MSEKEQGAVIGEMANMPESDKKFLLGVMAGLTAKQPEKEAESKGDKSA
jgi:hypothetical protein